MYRGGMSFEKFNCGVICFRHQWSALETFVTFWRTSGALFMINMSSVFNPRNVTSKPHFQIICMSLIHRERLQDVRGREKSHVVDHFWVKSCMFRLFSLRLLIFHRFKTKDAIFMAFSHSSFEFCQTSFWSLWTTNKHYGYITSLMFLFVSAVSLRSHDVYNIGFWVIIF